MTDKQGARPQPARKSPPGQGLAQRLGLARKGGRGLIGLQAAADLLRVVEIDRSGRLPRIVNFSIDPLMDNPAEAADQLLGLLHEKGISTRQVQAVVVTRDAELRQISLPVLAKGEMQALVRRELKEIVPDAAGGELLAYDFWYDRSTRKGRKTEVLVGVAPGIGPAHPR